MVNQWNDVGDWFVLKVLKQLLGERMRGLTTA